MTTTTASLASRCRAALRAVRPRLSKEAGVALPMAIVTLSIVTSLAGVAVLSATQGNDSTVLDSNTKAAQEAAETGLNVATYRLTMLQPTTGYCFTGSVVASGTSGWCQDSSSAESLGNGSSYTYWDSTDGTSSCVGYTVVNQSGLTQRCITAQGTSNGVTVREQARVAEYTATPLFPYAGLIGLNGVTMSGNATINGVVGTNKTYTISGNDTVSSVELGPSGNIVQSGVDHIGTSSQRTPAQGPIVLSPVNPGNSATVNNDNRITDGLASPVVAPYDSVSGSGTVSWNPTNRTLSLTGSKSITLGGGLYNFCSFSASGSNTISIAAGVTTQIFIDSPNRAGSGCPAGSGGFTMSGLNNIVNSSDNPLNLQIYVYDNSGGGLTLSGNTAFYGVFYAPLSAVTVSGNMAVDGGIAASTITTSGNTFNWDTRVGSLTAGTSGLYYRTAWEQCQAPTNATLNTATGGC